jgi:hypothetical protein
MSIHRRDAATSALFPYGYARVPSHESGTRYAA